MNFLFVCFFALNLMAQEKLPTKTYILAGRLIDGKSNKAKKNVTLEIEKNRIVKIHKGLKKDLPGKENKVIDLSAYTVLPGLMDMHVHLDGQFSKNVYLERFTKNQADYAIDATIYAKKTLLAGFTTIRNLGDAYRTTITIKKAINKGKIPGPRIYTAGKSLATTGGHADPTNGKRYDEMDFPGPESGVVNGAKEARAAVRQRYKEGADLIKITATGGVLSPAKSGQNPQFMKDELEEIIKTAKDYGFTVAAHAHGKEGMIRAIKAGVDSIEHGTFMDKKVALLMKMFGTYYVPTIMAGKWVEEKAKIDGFFPEIVRPKAAQIGPLIHNTFSMAYSMGVKIAFGTDSGVSAHGENAKEFVYMVEGGMPPMKAIQSATMEAAKLLKVENQLGSLESGKLADIIAVKGNPLKDISVLQQVAFVMKDGKVFKDTPTLKPSH